MTLLRHGILALAAVYACLNFSAGVVAQDATDATGADAASTDASAETNSFGGGGGGGGGGPLATCRQIASSVSRASQVFYPPSPQYLQGISHWATSSSENATCVVEPGTPADVGRVLQIVGQRRTPFAVKGGGHTSNPRFSSTLGIQIAMSRFNSVTYSRASSTAEIGAGLIWDDVYAQLERFGVSVVGGRVSGVGVAGFTLGGGYSWKSSQYGLTIDTVVAFELVLPNGTVRQITASSDADLFFALKGGFNNFGIVTKFVLRTFPQTQIYGGFLVFTGDKYPQILNATERFTNGAGRTDPKAAMIINLSSAQGAPISTVQIFYDAPTAPAGTFDDFLNIPGPLLQDVGTRSLLSFVQAAPGDVTGVRAAFETVSTTGYSLPLLNVLANEVLTLSQNINTTLQSTVILNFAIEPFHPSLFSHNAPGPAGTSAYPPTRTRALFPLNLFFGWVLPSFDGAFTDAITSSARRIEQTAGAQGLLPRNPNEAWLYGNYAISGTPLERIYGGNLGRLRAIRRRVDPAGVMALAGGWKF